MNKIAAAMQRYADEHNFTCDVCGREVFRGERVCAECLAALPAITVCCPLCGRRVGEAGVCLECKRVPFPLAKGRSVYVHEGEALRLVMRFKRGEKYLYRTFAVLSLERFRTEFPDAEALCFVPMTERAQKKRGYNQSELFAREIARRLGLPVVTAVKTRETEAQKRLGREAREENLRAAFRFKEGSVKGKHVVIIDDTLTTGATAGELGKVLRRAGAKRVSVFTFTSVEEKHPFGIPPKLSAQRP